MISFIEKDKRINYKEINNLVSDLKSMIDKIIEESQINSTDIQMYNLLSYEELFINPQLVLTAIPSLFYDIYKLLSSNRFYIDKTIYKIKDYVDKNYMDKINIDELADRFGYSSSHLMRKFKQEFNISIKQYKKELIMKYAASLLTSDSNIQINEIAQNLNFNDAPHFSKTFKQIYKMSPHEYRKRYNN